MILIRSEKHSNHLLPDQPIETTEHLMNWSGKSKGSKKKKKLKTVFVNQSQNRCGNEKKHQFELSDSWLTYQNNKRSCDDWLMGDTWYYIYLLTKVQNCYEPSKLFTSKLFLRSALLNLPEGGVLAAQTQMSHL